LTAAAGPAFPPPMPSKSPRREVRRLASAMGLTVLSRAIGLVREMVVVGALGAHAYTDSYFATSSVVLWLQNWAYGALALSFVPEFLSLAAADRAPWFRAFARKLASAGVVAGAIFFVGFGTVESLLLGGRRVLESRHQLMLATCLPATLLGGLYYARAVSSPDGIVKAAKAVLWGNIAGVIGLVGAAFSRRDPAAVLPLSLLVAQSTTAVLLARIRPAVQTAAGDAGRSQAVATTIENIAFNVNSVAQQAVAGRLPEGAVTLNSYASRLILVPLTGIVQPLQQRLLIAFTGSSEQDGARVLKRVVYVAVVGGAAIGLLLAGAVALGKGLLPTRAQVLTTTYRMDVIIGLYATYAGIVVANQSMARYYFSRARGGTYAATLIVAYAIGTAGRVWLASSVGLLALPLCSVIAEGMAAAGLAAFATRSLRGMAGAPTPAPACTDIRRSRTTATCACPHCGSPIEPSGPSSREQDRFGPSRSHGQTSSTSSSSPRSSISGGSRGRARIESAS
jgi:peptidoglycan biosynthesis protein MviN/MurJ (putative lipid II flippase)